MLTENERKTVRAHLETLPRNGWTRKAIEVVQRRLPAGTRTEAGRRHARLTTWLVDRTLWTAPGERLPYMRLMRDKRRDRLAD